ncbi:Os01g0367750 [Oryza sativa Japonica Group]|jgi:hypothetical protein|uniref:Os01g0367750 protein n=1 Tax=Oryza sativa subsp. japonica TaxID=39947 RepID=A0A0P0V330_ORYSJ|nr:Os01g0367750 [Oryza sativa Japonica Group]
MEVEAAGWRQHPAMEAEAGLLEAALAMEAEAHWLEAASGHGGRGGPAGVGGPATEAEARRLEAAPGHGGRGGGGRRRTVKERRSEEDGDGTAQCSDGEETAHGVVFACRVFY